MKVKSLITQLQNCDPEADVHIAYEAGDYWRTKLAPKVCDVDDGRVIRSDYHRGFTLIDEDRELSEQVNDGVKPLSVVVIR